MQNFLRTNGLKLVIRSHEVKDQVSIQILLLKIAEAFLTISQGYEIQHSNTLITVFSAPNYWYEFKTLSKLSKLKMIKYSDQMGNKV